MRFGKILSAAHFGICLGKDVRKVTQTISPQKKKKKKISSVVNRKIKQKPNQENKPKRKNASKVKMQAFLFFYLQSL